MNKRIFIAIGISPKMQNEILAWEEKFQNIPVRWLAGENLHVTLVAPWYDTDEGIREVNNLIAEVAERTTQFEICLKKVVYGPDFRSPRLIWAENTTPQNLITLKNDLDDALKIKTDNRPFRLHLTLARFKSEMFYNFPIKNLQENVMWAGKVDSVLLMESHLSPAGADYEVIGKFPLKSR